MSLSLHSGSVDRPDRDSDDASRLIVAVQEKEKRRLPTERERPLF